MTARTLLEHLGASIVAQTKGETVMIADNRNRMMGGSVNVGLKEDMSAQVLGIYNLLG